MRNIFIKALVVPLFLQLLFAGHLLASSVAVFPVADLSKGSNSVNFELTGHIIEELQHNGIDVLPLDEVISFMAVNRIRYLGYLETNKVLKVKNDLGLDLIILGTVSQQSDTGKPGVGLSLQLVRSADAQVVWSDSRGRSLADEQKLLGLNEPRSLEELQRLLTSDLVAGLPADLDEIAVPPEGAEEEMARQPKVEIVNLGPKYIRPGEQIKCAVRVVTLSDAYETPEVFIKVGSRIHLAREARDPLIYAEYEGEVYEATREYEDIIKEAEADADRYFREAGIFKTKPLREAEEDQLPLFRDAESIYQAPLREAVDEDGNIREAETMGTSPLLEATEDGRLLRQAEDEQHLILEATEDGRLLRQAGIQTQSLQFEAQVGLKKQDQTDLTDDFLNHLVNTDYTYKNKYVDFGSGVAIGHQQGIFRLAESLDRAPLMEAADDNRLLREAADDNSIILEARDEIAPVIKEASAEDSIPVLLASREKTVYYEATWIGSDSMSGTSAANFNGIGTPTVDVAMATNDSRFFEGIWSGSERDDRYPVSLVLRWPDGKQVVSYLGSYSVDSHPPRIGLDLKGDVLEGIVTFRDKLVIVPRLFNREPLSHWEIIIEDDMGNVVRRNRGWGNLPSQFTWWGKHRNRVKMPDGMYRIVLKVWDRAENMGSADQSVAFMYSPPTAALSAVMQEKEFSLDIRHQGNLPLAHWYVEIRSQSGRVIKSVEGDTLPATVDLELTTLLKNDTLFGIIELRDVLGNKSRQEIDDLYQLARQEKEEDIPEVEDDGLKVESWDADF